MDKQLLELASSNTYITPSRYISGRIVEYDIKSANITMLRKYGKITDDYYHYLASLPKINREIEIGLLIRNDKDLYNTIKDGIIEAKKLLLASNGIEPYQIVRIANDAVYINTSFDLKTTVFDDVEFKKKSIWGSVMVISKHLICFFLRDISGSISIDFKGINDTALQLHSMYMVSVIAEIINTLENGGIQSAIDFVSRFYDDYINLRLDKEFYREFNSESLYLFKNSNFKLMDISNINDIDINYNLFIIREIWGILMELYNIEISRK